ncbi:hypothetical protein C0995_014082 [Termitomyces sp. Mi166|nr:hypothetical protein C0995_014082 [Termitomyces sp. Mi166\
MIDKEAWAALSDDDRRLIEEMRRRFPRMAVWQMFFACREAEDALKHLDRLVTMGSFPEITSLTLVEQWTPTDISLATSPDAINTAWGTPLSSWISKSPVSTTDAIPALEENRREIKAAESKSDWPNIIKSTRKRDLAVIDEDMATSIIQHDPAYARIQLGLFISMIDDIRDPTRQDIAQEAHSKPAKRKGIVLLSENNKHPRTRRSVALEEARRSDYEQGLKLRPHTLECSMSEESQQKDVCDGITNRDMVLLRIQHGPHNSPAPSSLLRVKDTGTIVPKKNYEPHEYFRITITAEIAHGSTGDAHAATIDFLGPNGKTISFFNVVKLAFAPVQKKRLRHEFDVYSCLLTANARGIPHVFGLFKDIETEALALIMEHAGPTLWDCRLPDKSQRHQFTISESEKSIHDAGVRHRDLRLERLENLTIKSNGDPCIIDFDRAEMEADERSLEREKEKLQNVLDGRHEYRISRETTEEDPNSTEEWENGTERSSSPEFRIGVL